MLYPQVKNILPKAADTVRAYVIHIYEKRKEKLKEVIGMVWSDPVLLPVVRVIFHSQLNELFIPSCQLIPFLMLLLLSLHLYPLHQSHYDFLFLMLLLFRYRLCP
jgi:hypothetical protein